MHQYFNYKPMLPTTIFPNDLRRKVSHFVVFQAQETVLILRFIIILVVPNQNYGLILPIVSALQRHENFYPLARF